MTTYVYRDGKLIEKSKAPPKSGAFVISDTMQIMKHPITGKLMDSKSEFRAVTRAHGCVEVGNDVQRDTRRIEGFDSDTRKRDIYRAITELGG
jgi:hypothetical protein